MIKVLNEFRKQAAALIKKVGINDARKQKPEWFTDTGPRKTTKLDPRTNKPVSGSTDPKTLANMKTKDMSQAQKDAWRKGVAGAKRASKSAPKTGKSGFTEAQLAKYRAAYRDPKAWAKVPPAIKKKLLA